jgi:WD40 repeat protein
MMEASAQASDEARPASCPRCGVRRDWRGICPACALAGALDEGPAGGAALGPYRLLEEIGRGGAGRVWRARQAGVDRDVAVKLLRGGAAGDAVGRERFRREAVAAARLRHPGIVTVHEVGEADGEPYLVLELVRGGSLADRLQAGPLPPRPAAELVRALADAVQHAHDAGVLHRDLKPGNVLLDADRADAPRLTDFGLARLSDGAAETLTRTHEALGTPAYLAPEQADGGSLRHGPATDVYGLGAILYHCLTGRPPFAGGHPAAVLRAVIEAPPAALNAELPRELEAICLKCLEKDPGHRYADAAALRDELDRWLRGEPVHARPVSTLTRTWRGCWRRPALSAACMALAAAVAAVVWLLLHPVAARVPVASLATNWPVRLPPPPVLLPLGDPLCSALAFSPDGRQLAVGDGGGRVQVFASGEPKPHSAATLPQSIRDLAWSADGRHLLAADLGGDWRFWEARPWLRLLGQGTNGFRADAAAVAPEGERFFFSLADGSGELWRVVPAGPVREARLPLPEGVWGASFSADGRRLLTVFPSEKVGVRDGLSGALLWEAEGLQPFAKFSPDGSLVGTATRNPGGPGGEVQLRSAATGQAVHTLRLPDALPSGLTFSPEGARLAVATARGIGIWKWGDPGSPLQPLAAEQFPNLTEFSPDGLRVLCVSAAGEVKLRDAHTGALLAGPVFSPHLFWRIQLAPDGHRLATPGADGVVRLWDFSPALPERWAGPEDAARELRRLGTLPALRLAAWLEPGASETWHALAALTRRPGTPAALAEARWLESFAARPGPAEAPAP